MTSLNDALMIELAYCRHTDKSVSETAARIEALVTRKHVLMRTDYCLGGEQL